MVTINNISEASRIVIKVGSSLVTSKDGNINERFLDSIATDLLRLREQNKEIIIVSSGAVSLGNEINKDKKNLSLSESQAASSIGQIKLINGWKKSLENKGLNIAQILITADDTENRRRYLNARSTFEELLKNTKDNACRIRIGFTLLKGALLKSNSFKVLIAINLFT